MWLNPKGNSIKMSYKMYITCLKNIAAMCNIDYTHDNCDTKIQEMAHQLFPL